VPPKSQALTKRSYYNCAKCPAYCCSIYDLVNVGKRDVQRLAKHFGVGVRTALRRFTKTHRGERILQRKPDPIFGKACTFLDPQTRRCTVYEARPEACRAFPKRARCAFYDLLTFERLWEENENALPLVAITFLDREKWGRARATDHEHPSKR
jgi:Fe-S-cluster containining protein